MARKIKKRVAKKTIAVIVDGQDEKWYIQKAKEHYPCEAIKHASIQPEMAEKKKVQDLFDTAHERIDAGFDHVILMVDMDDPLNKPAEFERFKVLYEQYRRAKCNNITPANRWMKNLIVIVNSPCLEYWYLLHFGKTTKFYDDYASLRNDLRRIPDMSRYEKSEDYYLRSPDIYQKLDGTSNRLQAARNNAFPFSLAECREKGCSEMNQLFDFFDNLSL